MIAQAPFERLECGSTVVDAFHDGFVAVHVVVSIDPTASAGRAEQPLRLRIGPKDDFVFKCGKCLTFEHPVELRVRRSVQRLRAGTGGAGQKGYKQEERSQKRQEALFCECAFHVLKIRSEKIVLKNRVVVVVMGKKKY